MREYVRVHAYVCVCVWGGGGGGASLCTSNLHTFLASCVVSDFGTVASSPSDGDALVVSSPPSVVDGLMPKGTCLSSGSLIS